MDVGEQIQGTLMFTQYLAHGSVLLTVLLLGLTAQASYVCLRVLFDFRGALRRSEEVTRIESATPTHPRQQA